MERLPIYLIDENNAEMLINSMVAAPAHEKYFLAFNSQQEQQKFVFDEEKHRVMGVVIAANKPIYRNDNGSEYYVVFTRKAIEKLATDYFKTNKHNLINVQHNGDVYSNKAVMIETFFYDKTKHILPKEWGHIEEGSWIATYQIFDEQLWQLVKSGAVRGFSIELLANVKELKLNQNTTIMKKNTKFAKLFTALADVFGEEVKEITTIDGVKLTYVGDLAVGTVLNIVAQDGTQTLAPEGIYIVEIDGAKKELVVGGDGVITAINDVVIEEQKQDHSAVDALLDAVTKLAEKVKHLETKLSLVEKRFTVAESKPQAATEKEQKKQVIKINV